MICEVGGFVGRPSDECRGGALSRWRAGWRRLILIVRRWAAGAPTAISRTTFARATGRWSIGRSAGAAIAAAGTEFSAWSAFTARSIAAAGRAVIAIADTATEALSAEAAASASIEVKGTPVLLGNAELRGGVPALEPRFHFGLRQIHELLALVIGEFVGEESLELLRSELWVHRRPEPAHKLPRLFHSWRQMFQVLFARLAQGRNELRMQFVAPFFVAHRLHHDPQVRELRFFLGAARRVGIISAHLFHHLGAMVVGKLVDCGAEGLLFFGRKLTGGFAIALTSVFLNLHHSLRRGQIAQLGLFALRLSAKPLGVGGHGGL